MIKMKSHLVAAIALLLCAAPVLRAEEPASQPVVVKSNAQLFLDRYRQLLQTLDLKPEQQQKIDGLLATAGTQLRDLKASDAAQQFSHVVSDLNLKIADVLDDKQKSDFSALVQKMRGMSAGPITRMHEALSKLGLSDEQKGEVNDIFADTRTKMKAWAAHAQAAGAAANTDEMQAKLRAITDAAKQKVLGLLTPDQRQKFEKDPATTQP